MTIYKPERAVAAYQLLKEICEEDGLDLQSFLEIQQEIDSEV